MGVTSVREQRRDSFYYQPQFVSLPSSALALSGLVQASIFAISMWHSSLCHPSLLIFQKFLSVLNIHFPKSIYVSSLITLVILIKATSYLLLSLALPPPLLLILFLLMFELLSFLFLLVFTTMLFLLITTLSIYGFTRYVVSWTFIQPLSPSSTLLKTTSPPPLKLFTRIMRVNF